MPIHWFWYFWYLHFSKSLSEYCVSHFILVRHTLVTGCLWILCISLYSFKACFKWRWRTLFWGPEVSVNWAVSLLSPRLPAVVSHCEKDKGSSDWDGEQIGLSSRWNYFGLSSANMISLGTTSDLMSSAWLDFCSQCQIEGSPYISSSLDWSKMENNVKSPGPPGSFPMRMPQGSSAAIRILWHQVIGYICGKGTVK